MDAGFYAHNWQTADAGLSTDSLYRIEIFVGTISLGYRDVDPDPGPPRGTCKRDDFCQFNNGSNLAIKTIIESGAVCFELGKRGDDLDVCATANLDPGDALTLADDDGNIGVATVANNSLGGTINLQPCTDLRSRGSGLGNANIGRVDLRTFGDCVEIATLEEFVISGTATMCEAFGEATDPSGGNLDSLQAERMTVLRFSKDEGKETGFTVALPHSDAVSCASSEATQQLGRDLNRLQRFARLARNTWRAVSDRVVAWLQPAPLYARTMVRCNRGGCSSDGPFRSSFQVGLPAWMDAPDGFDLGSHTIGTTLTVRVRTWDSGQFEPLDPGDPDNTTPDPVPELANDVRLTFTVNGGTPVSVSPLRTGPVGGFADGIAEFEFDVGPGANTVLVQGIGVGTAASSSDSTFLNVYAPSFNADTSVAIGKEKALGVGTLTFNATGIVPLAFSVDPGDANLGDGGDLLKAVLLDKDGDLIEVCAVDGNGDPVTSFEGTVTLTAIKNNGDPVDLENAGPISLVDGCATFENLTIDKTGAYRLVANGEFESLKFNVRPAKKK
jgi:hypothetical protein